MKNIFKSWQTTLTGVLVFITATSNQFILLLDGIPETNPDWQIIIGAFMVMLGFGVARDNNVNSKKAGAE